MSELRELNNVSLPFALDKKGNYIYIKDADRETKYYCPCCNKEVNTIAIDDDIDYIMPPHYRHYPNQSCSGESLAHWVYKMWLFDKGSQFYVSNGLKKDLHIVKSINIENTYTTDYGGYRPDITITTTYDKIFYFELNFSNLKRSDDYFCKWSQLNNDVIEVDVKKLLKESLNNKIPTFRLIYSEGICFDDKYNKRDTFAGIANKLHIRKEEIKRQDMLNYKTIWEKLDWFFDSIKMYKAMKSTMNDVLNSFRNIPFEEMELCFNIIKNISCVNDKQGFRDIINESFESNIKTYVSNIYLTNKCIPKINYYINIRSGFNVNTDTINKKCKTKNFCFPKASVFFENRKWYFGCTFYTKVISGIDNIINQIYNYYNMIDYIDDYFTWYRYPLLYNKLSFSKTIKLDKSDEFQYISINTSYDFNKIVNEIDTEYNNKLFNLYLLDKQNLDKIKNEKYIKLLLNNKDTFIEIKNRIQKKINCNNKLDFVIEISSWDKNYCNFILYKDIDEFKCGLLRNDISSNKNFISLNLNQIEENLTSFYLNFVEIYKNDINYQKVDAILKNGVKFYNFNKSSKVTEPSFFSSNNLDVYFAYGLNEDDYFKFYRKGLYVDRKFNYFHIQNDYDGKIRLEITYRDDRSYLEKMIYIEDYNKEELIEMVEKQSVINLNKYIEHLESNGIYFTKGGNIIAK